MITKKHFIRIAHLIRDHKPDFVFVLALCDYFYELNPKFDRDKFLEFCRYMKPKK